MNVTKGSEGLRWKFFFGRVRIEGENIVACFKIIFNLVRK